MADIYRLGNAILDLLQSKGTVIAWNLIVLFAVFVQDLRTNALDDKVIRVTNATCESTYGVRFGEPLVFEWSSGAKSRDYDFLANYHRCRVTIINTGGSYDQVCIKHISDISYLDCYRLLNIESPGESWSELELGFRVCYYDSACANRNSRKVYVDFKTPIRYHNYTFQLEVTLKKGYYYDTSGDSDSWSSWSSDSDDSGYNEDYDDDDFNIFRMPWFYFIITTVFCCCVCTAKCIQKANRSDQSQNTMTTARTINGVIPAPFVDHRGSSEDNPSSLPPQYQFASAPPDYNTLLLQCQNNGTGFAAYSNDTPSTQEVNNTNVDGVDLNKVQNELQNDTNAIYNDAAEADVEQQLPPPPSYEDFLSDTDKYTSGPSSKDI